MIHPWGKSVHALDATVGHYGESSDSVSAHCSGIEEKMKREKIWHRKQPMMAMREKNAEGTRTIQKATKNFMLQHRSMDYSAW